MCIEKNILPFAFIILYKMYHPEIRKIYYCTKTICDQHKVMFLFHGSFTGLNTKFLPKIQAVTRFCQTIEYRHLCKRHRDDTNSPKLTIFGLVSMLNTVDYSKIIKISSGETIVSHPRFLLFFYSSF